MRPSEGPNPKIKGRQNSAQLSFAGIEFYRFEVPIGCKAFFLNWNIK